MIIPNRNPETNEDFSVFEKFLIRTQYAEYKNGHRFHKPMESLLGFVSVLPGAFSAFRWEAIKGEPLRVFLKGARNDFRDSTKFPS